VVEEDDIEVVEEVVEVIDEGTQVEDDIEGETQVVEVTDEVTQVEILEEVIEEIQIEVVVDIRGEVDNNLEVFDKIPLFFWA